MLTLPGTGGDLPPPVNFVEAVKKDVKIQVTVDENQKSFQHIQTLVKQGKYLEMLQLQNTDATWKSFVYNMPRGPMKFVLNASLDTLPTLANLSQWGKRTNNKCRCGTKETLNHVLNCCQLALTEGRYTYRHDCVLNYIASCLDTDKYKCYMDIPGHQTTNGGTLPPDVAVSTLEPDIVIVDRNNKKAAIFELTCPPEHRIETANTLKLNKYSHFNSDQHEMQVAVDAFEVGSKTGHLTKDNKARLAKMHKYCKKGIKLKQFVSNISAITILGSYYIFNCRSQVLWPDMPPILAPFSNM